MSAILGHDIDGRPLRAGDLVKFVGKESEILISREKFGEGVFTVFGPPKTWALEMFGEGVVQLEGDDGLHATTDCIRKIRPGMDDDLKSCGQSFNELLADLKKQRRQSPEKVTLP